MVAGVSGCVRALSRCVLLLLSVLVYAVLVYALSVYVCVGVRRVGLRRKTKLLGYRRCVCVCVCGPTTRR